MEHLQLQWLRRDFEFFAFFYTTHYILLLDCYVHSFPTILVLSESVILRIITLEKKTYNIYYVLFSAPTLELCLLSTSLPLTKFARKNISYIMCRSLIQHKGDVMAYCLCELYIWSLKNQYAIPGT